MITVVLIPENIILYNVYKQYYEPKF